MGPSSEEPPADDASDQSEDIDAYLCALADAAVRTRLTGRGGCHRSAEGESSDPVPKGAAAEPMVVGTQTAERIGCHGFTEGESSLVPTVPTAGALVVVGAFLPASGRIGCHPPEEGQALALVPDRHSPTGPKLGTSSLSGTGQRSSADAGTLPGSYSKQGDAAAGGGSVSALGAFMILSPADGSSFR